MMETMLFLLGLAALVLALIAPAVWAAGLIAAWAILWGCGAIVGQLKVMTRLLRQRPAPERAAPPAAAPSPEAVPEDAWSAEQRRLGLLK